MKKQESTVTDKAIERMSIEEVEHFRARYNRKHPDRRMKSYGKFIAYMHDLKKH